MYIPDYNSALFELETFFGFEVDYSAYVSGVLRRKHYGHTKKYHI